MKQPWSYAPSGLRIAVEREKEFGGHLRDWPDLRGADEPIIQQYLKEAQ